MSATLYALVVLQGTSGLAFEPGYTSKEQCLSVYRGPSVSCFQYDPEGVTWTAFFKTPAGGFGSVWRFPNESTCQNYIGALRSDVPSACRQLAHPEPCPVACKLPETPAAKPPEPDPKPDPASIETKPSDIQVGGKQYTKVAGLAWVESTKPDSFADVSVGPNDLQSKDQPSPLKTAEAPKKRVVVAPHYYDRAPQPLQAFIDTVMLPFDFLSYPGGRGW
jgi:hypothetical protein